METKTAKLRVGGHRADSRRRYTYALVSSEDYLRDEISGVKWSIHSAGYAYRLASRNGKQEMIYLHREVLSLQPGEGVVDHISGDPLDCRRENLRVLPSNAHNLQNRRKASGSSGYRGVTYNKARKRWIAQVGFQGKRLYGGCFQDEREAALAAEALRRRHLAYAYPDSKLAAEYGDRLDQAVQRQALRASL